MRLSEKIRIRETFEYKLMAQTHLTDSEILNIIDRGTVIIHPVEDFIKVLREEDIFTDEDADSFIEMLNKKSEFTWQGIDVVEYEGQRYTIDRIL